MIQSCLVANQSQAFFLHSKKKLSMISWYNVLKKSCGNEDKWACPLQMLLVRGWKVEIPGRRISSLEKMPSITTTTNSILETARKLLSGLLVICLCEFLRIMNILNKILRQQCMQPQRMFSPSSRRREVCLISCMYGQDQLGVCRSDTDALNSITYCVWTLAGLWNQAIVVQTVVAIKSIVVSSSVLTGRRWHTRVIELTRNQNICAIEKTRTSVFCLFLSSISLLVRRIWVDNVGSFIQRCWIRQYSLLASRGHETLLLVRTKIPSMCA